MGVANTSEHRRTATNRTCERYIEAVIVKRLFFGFKYEYFVCVGMGNLWETNGCGNCLKSDRRRKEQRRDKINKNRQLEEFYDTQIPSG